MEELTKYLDRLKDDLGILAIDIRKMLHNKQKETEKSDAPKMGLKTMQTMTTLYEDRKAIEAAKDNPELDFIDRSLKRILSR